LPLLRERDSAFIKAQGFTKVEKFMTPDPVFVEGVCSVEKIAEVL
jgi:hypothetical protein